MYKSCFVVIHPVQSVIIPSSEIICLGFMLISRCMYTTVSLTQMQHTCQLLDCTESTIQEVAELARLVVASFSGVATAPICYYRQLETALALEAEGFSTPRWTFPRKPGQWWMNQRDN